MTISIRDTQHNNVHNDHNNTERHYSVCCVFLIVMLSDFAECLYAECSGTVYIAFILTVIETY